MNILLVNSNTSPSHTEIVAATARTAVAPGTEITALTAPYGARYIDSRTEATIAAHATLHVLASNAEGFDAAVIAAFVDPGLGAVRELLPFPVVGIAEAAMLTACMLGARFAIVTIGPRAVPLFYELVGAYGLRGRLAGVRHADGKDLDPVTNPNGTATALTRIAREAVSEDGADVVLLGGAPLAKLRAMVAADIEVPVLDGITCGVRQAELLVNLGAGKASAGSYGTPPTAGLVNVADDIVRFFRTDNH